MLTKSVRDTSVLRGLLFAWSNLPKEFPDAWKLAVEFATKGKVTDYDRTSLKLLLSNLEKLDVSAFDSDDSLYLELLNTPATEPIGVVLIPELRV